MTNGPTDGPRSRRGAAPAWVNDGLAVYDLGADPPLLVMPNPQGMVRAPEAHGPLVELLVGLGRRVLTFDPPGAFASPRPAHPGWDWPRCWPASRRPSPSPGWRRRWT